MDDLKNSGKKVMGAGAAVALWPMSPLNPLFVLSLPVGLTLLAVGAAVYGAGKVKEAVEGK
jgi:hypothetical protein